MNFNRNKVKVYAYNRFSESAKAIAQALGVKRIKHRGSRLNPLDKTIINWGSTKRNWFNCRRTLNHPSRVQFASDKLKFFQTTEHLGLTPDYTTDMEVAKIWVRDGYKVCIRHTTTGHEGAGLVIVNSEEEIEPAPLYTKYIKKKEEYRVHVVGHKVIFVQRKARRFSCDNPNWEIRNHHNGFVFTNQDVQPPECVINAALAVMDSLCLDFGGADVIYNEHQDRAYVLEVNTAPGMEGTTVGKYADALSDYLL